MKLFHSFRKLPEGYYRLVIIGWILVPSVLAFFLNLIGTFFSAHMSHKQASDYSIRWFIILMIVYFPVARLVIWVLEGFKKDNYPYITERSELKLQQTYVRQDQVLHIESKPQNLTKKKYVVLRLFLVGIAFIAIIAVYKRYEKITTDQQRASAQKTADSISSEKFARDQAILQASLEVRKKQTCTKASALENFEYYMKFYYPDWKIYGSPGVIENSECTYRIQFTTLDPAYDYSEFKVVIIVEISWDNDFTHFYFNVIRGHLPLINP
jgi:hypothetical protein